MRQGDETCPSKKEKVRKLLDLILKKWKLPDTPKIKASLLPWIPLEEAALRSPKRKENNMLKELISKYGTLANALQFLETVANLAAHVDPALGGEIALIDEVCDYLQSLKSKTSSNGS